MKRVQIVLVGILRRFHYVQDLETGIDQLFKENRGLEAELASLKVERSSTKSASLDLGIIVDGLDKANCRATSVSLIKNDRVAIIGRRHCTPNRLETMKEALDRWTAALRPLDLVPIRFYADGGDWRIVTVRGASSEAKAAA